MRDGDTEGHGGRKKRPSGHGRPSRQSRPDSGSPDRPRGLRRIRRAHPRVRGLGSRGHRRARDCLDSMLSGLIHNGGWAFILAATGFVIFALWLAFSRYGKITLGQGRRGARVQDRLMGRDDVQRGHGHRPDVLRGERAAGALRHSAARDRPRRPRPRRCNRHGHHAVPLDAAPVGDLRGRGLAIAYSTFRRGRRQTDQRRLHPAVRRAGTPTARGGRVIDILAIFATLFGSAASLGLGALQIGSGIEVLGWMSKRRHRRCWSPSSRC